MLSNKKIICPNNLINVAKKKGTIDAAIVNAGEIFPMESVHKAVQHNLINPKLYIALATMPIFSGSWGLTKTIEGLIIFTIKILDHEITYK